MCNFNRNLNRPPSKPFDRVIKKFKGKDEVQYEDTRRSSGCPKITDQVVSGRVLLTKWGFGAFQPNSTNHKRRHNNSDLLFSYRTTRADDVKGHYELLTGKRCDADNDVPCDHHQ